MRSIPVGWSRSLGWIIVPLSNRSISHLGCLRFNSSLKPLGGDSKTQGNWGELVLERVLEKSGLEKDREYFVQQSFVTEDGNRVFPDVVINLPDGKKMIVDSKVTLTAYERYSNEDDDELKSQYLKEHISG